MLRNRRWAFLITLIAIPAVAAAVTVARGAEYEATTTLLLRPAVGTDAGQADSDRAANTTSGLLDLPLVATAAARRVGESASDIEDAIEVDPRSNSDLVDIKATGDSEDQATRRANAYAAAYIGARRRRELPQPGPPDPGARCHHPPAERQRPGRVRGPVAPAARGLRLPAVGRGR